MTRKDYELIAAAIATSHEEASHLSVELDPKGGNDLPMVGVELAARCLADTLNATNPRFDRDRFLRACGIEA